MPEGSVRQEFYCTKSGGGCGGYFIAKINRGINGVVEVICPNPDCKHAHYRSIVNGELREAGRFKHKPIETLRPTRSSFSWEPRTKGGSKKSTGSLNERDATVIKRKRDYLKGKKPAEHDDQVAKSFLRQSIEERFLRER